MFMVSISDYNQLRNLLINMLRSSDSKDKVGCMCIDWGSAGSIDRTTCHTRARISKHTLIHVDMYEFCLLKLSCQRIIRLSANLAKPWVSLQSPLKSSKLCTKLLLQQRTLAWCSSRTPCSSSLLTMRKHASNLCSLRQWCLTPKIVEAPRCNGQKSTRRVPKSSMLGCLWRSVAPTRLLPLRKTTKAEIWLGPTLPSAKRVHTMLSTKILIWWKLGLLGVAIGTEC